MRKDWIGCTFNEITDIIGDGLHGTPIYNEDGDYYFINGNNLNDGRINIKPETKRVDVSEFLKYQKKLNEQTILLSINGTIGNTAFYDNENVVLGKSACYINLSSQIDKKFIRLNLTTNGFVQYALKNATGSTIKNVGLATVRAYTILLPPLPEQRAIVKKLESLFSSLDAGVADLKKAQQQLKIYRQAVLKKAFEGELTNIQEKPDVVSFEGEIQIVSGNTPKDLKTAEKIGDLPFYKVSDMNLLGNEIYMSNSNIFLSSAQFHKMKLKTFPKGTIIFPKRGGAILTNKKRILSQDSTFDLNLMGIIPNENFSSKYLYYYFYKMDLAKIADGSAVPQINNKNINPLQIQKYSIDEQKEIVKQIESRLSVCDSIEQNIKESLVKAEALRQSILKKAFEGNLLTAQELAACKQAADYEPASVLLQRIRNEKLKIRKK